MTMSAGSASEGKMSKFCEQLVRLHTDLLTDSVVQHLSWVLEERLAERVCTCIQVLSVSAHSK